VPREAFDDEAQQQIKQAIELVDELSGPEFLECHVCGRMGLPERIMDYDCLIWVAH